MLTRRTFLTICAAFWAMPAIAQHATPRPNLSRIFQRNGVTGTFVALNATTHHQTFFNPTRATKRFIPASTFKIANSLIALETGVIADETEIIPFGGRPQPFKAWEQDMTLRDAIRVSNVPVYQELARRITLSRYQSALQSLAYGNQQTGTNVETFWLKGPLTISAIEQAQFLATLANHALPFSARSQSITRSILHRDSQGNAKLFGKTGWSNATKPGIGWFVGWVENGPQIHSFALNIDIHARADAAKRIQDTDGCDIREIDEIATSDDVDAVVVATSTPDLTFPSAATMVQAELGMTKGFAFDVQAVCAGFVYALSNANALILSGQAKRVMVIGAETFSRIMDWTDRSTCVLFGDGAGALILEGQPGTGAASDRGILATDLHSDGAHNDILYVDGGVSSTQTTGVLRMEGKEVFRHAIAKLAATGRSVLEKAGLSAENVDWLVPHQANIRIIQGTAKKMGIPMDNVVVTVQNHGNTSAASIPLALSVGVSEGKIKQGDLVLTEAIGGGLAWGAVVLRW